MKMSLTTPPEVIFRGVVWNKHHALRLPRMSNVQLDAISEPIALVVDDEPLIRMDTADIIADAGYHVIEASSADQAFEFLSTYCSLQLLFTDVQTGGDLDGFELAREVATRWPDIEVVVASGMQLPGEGDLPENATFIQKPFSAETVLEALREHFPNGPFRPPHDYAA